ncbi:conserved hypothetical protein [Altererythrobacter sp. B11]|uniref:DUF1993 domain-containing protein n=1 Tax=Altererythrobacter sp. B11 TaxID=2060312 RepID=UPI000DC6E388|nr:DUF1993 domain-containing protein [Altererythrobacter sp. B11]BBC74042.1 conserved hypothetical protein [Altererythrobacter sp. B11]
MPLSLHAAIIPSKLQILRSGKGWLDKAESCGIPEAELVEARLIDDMLPFAYQVKSMADHSKGAIEGVRAGVFTPKFKDTPPATFAEMRSLLDDAIAFLESVTEEEMESFIGKDMRFEIGEKKLPFTAEDFLLTFSQTNFFFHACTAYGVLRMKGVAVGKLDYLGALRLKAA